MNNWNWHPKISKRTLIESPRCSVGFGWYQVTKPQEVQPLILTDSSSSSIISGMIRCSDEILYPICYKLSDTTDGIVSTLISDSCWLLVVANQFIRSQSIFTFSLNTFHGSWQQFLYHKVIYRYRLKVPAKQYHPSSPQLHHPMKLQAMQGGELLLLNVDASAPRIHRGSEPPDMVPTVWSVSRAVRSKDVLRCSKLFLVNCWHRVWKAHW